MSECSQAQERLLAGTGLIHELPEDIQGHVGECDDCREFALRRRRLRRLSKSTQEIVRNDVELSPAAWARIRSAVEDEAAPEPMMTLFFRWFPVAALPVLVIALGWALLNQDSTVGDVDRTAGTPAVAHAQGASVPVVTAEVGHFPTLDHKSGGMIEAGDKASVAKLALGHKLEFEAHSKVEVLTLSEKKVALKLRKGKLTCEVRKLRADETFEVHAGGMRVAVVGTRFTVELNSEGEPSVSVSEGRVAVRVSGGDERMLEAGDSYDAPPEPVANAEPETPNDGVQANVDVSGVPIMKKAEKPVSAKRAPKKVAGAKRDGGVEALNQRADDRSEEGPKKTPKLIEVTVTETMNPHTDTSDSAVRSRLIGVIGMIRSGNCSAALGALKSINLSEGAGRYRSDITYLSGYCHRKQGSPGRATRLFALYEKLKGSRGWKVPTSHDEVLPIPSSTHLGR